MARTFEIHPVERAWTRKGALAVEVLDAVTLQRVSRGVRVEAVGLGREPVVNHGGLFTWRDDDLSTLTGLAIDPGAWPLVGVEIPAANVVRPVHVVALQPRSDYPFAPGTTALRGALIESMPPAPPPVVAPTPIAGAVVRLEWLDDDGVTWQAPAQRFVTDARGQFAAFVPLGPGDQPALDANGRLSLRLFANRTPSVLPAVEKSTAFSLPQARASDVVFAWDALA